MTHCRSYERTYGLEALWRFEGTEHRKLPHRSDAFTGWSEAVINSNASGIFISSGKLLLSFYRCYQPPESTKMSHPPSARALHPHSAQDSHLSSGWQSWFKVWQSCSCAKTFFCPCLLAWSPIQTHILEFPSPSLALSVTLWRPLLAALTQSRAMGAMSLVASPPWGSSHPCWALTPFWLVWRSKGKDMYQMPVLKQSNNTKSIQNYLKLSLLLAELPSEQHHGSFNITRKLFMEGTVGGKKKIPSVRRAGCLCISSVC